MRKRWAQSRSADERRSLICGVPPEAFGRIDELLSEFHPRFSYDQGTLDDVPGSARRASGGLLAVHGGAVGAIPAALLRWLDPGDDDAATRSRVDQRLIGRMLEAMALALDMPIQSTGSTTLSRSKHDRGLQPDESVLRGRARRVVAARPTSRGSTRRPTWRSKSTVTRSGGSAAADLRRDRRARRSGDGRGDEMEFLRLTTSCEYDDDRSAAWRFRSSTAARRHAFLQRATRPTRMRSSAVSSSGHEARASRRCREPLRSSLKSPRCEAAEPSSFDDQVSVLRSAEARLES